MAKTHKSFEKTVGCSCKDEMVEQNSGTYLVESITDEKGDRIPNKIFFSKLWYRCPNCGSNFVPVISLIFLHERNDDIFDAVLENITLFDDNYINVWYSV